MQYTNMPYYNVSVHISKIFMPFIIKIVIFISVIVGLVSQVRRNIVLLLVLITIVFPANGMKTGG